MIRASAHNTFNGDRFLGHPSKPVTVETQDFLIDTNMDEKVLRVKNVPTLVLPGNDGATMNTSIWVVADLVLTKLAPLTVEEWARKNMMEYAAATISRAVLEIDTSAEYDSIGVMDSGFPILAQTGLRTWTRDKSGIFSMPAQIYLQGLISPDTFPPSIKQRFPLAPNKTAILNYLIKQRQVREIDAAIRGSAPTPETANMFAMPTNGATNMLPAAMIPPSTSRYYSSCPGTSG